MKICIISEIQIFPPESGGQRRSSSLVEFLAQRGHEVLVYSFTGRKEDYLKRKKSSFQKINEGTTQYINRTPFYGILQFLTYKLKLPPIFLTLLSFFYIPKGLKKHIQRSDLVIVDFPFLFPVIRKQKVKTILNTHNLEHKLYKFSPVSSIVKKLEIRAVKNFDQVLFCSKEDMDFFDKRPGFKLAPNGIDPTRFMNMPGSKQSLRLDLQIPPDKKIILFSGSNYGPNIEAFNFISNFANENKTFLEENNFLFLIVGTVHSKEKRGDYLLSTGWVENVDPYIMSCDMAINPVNAGSGTNIKMMEYLAANLVILTTTFGARGLKLVDGKQAILFERENLKEKLENIMNKDIMDFSQMVSSAYEKNEQYFNFKLAFSNPKLLWNI